jgi:hypothetical protein
MIEELDRTHPELIGKCKNLSGDRGYDDTKLYEKLWDDYKIKPVIDICNKWKDKDKTRQLQDYENVIYNYKGNVYCVCMETGIEREMCVGGFEKHYIRGLRKMNIRCGIALCVMLAMAVGRIKENQADKMRSLVQSA